MGLINRFDKKEVFIDPFSRTSIKYVKISPIGEKIINSEKLDEKHFIFSTCIEKLTQGKFNNIFQIVSKTLSGESDFITKEVWTIFLSGYDEKFSNVYYSQDDIIEIILEFKRLTEINQKNFISEIKEYCEEKHKKRLEKKLPKNCDRDWGNWVNEAQQSIMCLSMTTHFTSPEQGKYNSLYIRFGNPIVGDGLKNAKRSQEQKEAYFLNNNISKNPEYELHHIFPLYEAKNINHWILIDKWENMIYINGNTHNFIHAHSRDRMYKINIEKENNNLIISSTRPGNPTNKEVIFNVDVFYNPKNWLKMKQKNDELTNW